MEKTAINDIHNNDHLPSQPKPCLLPETPSTHQEQIEVSASGVSPAITLHAPHKKRCMPHRAVAAILIMANVVAMLSFGVGLNSSLSLAHTLHVPKPSLVSWTAASYPLTAGAFVLASGRLGAIYGHTRVLLWGGAWWTLCTLINGFTGANFIVFNTVRGLSGIGGAMVVPNAVAVIGTTFPPGKGRNRCLGLFAAGAPVGGWLGAVVPGLLESQAQRIWTFVFMAACGALVFGCLAIGTPPERPLCRDEGMDWIGSGLGISALVSFNFVWNQAPTAEWASAYEIVLLIVSVLLFIAFAVWELKFAVHPIMPLAIWTAPSFAAVILVVLFSFMSYGTFIWYMVKWQQSIRHWSTLSSAIGLAPLAVGSAFAAFIAAWLVPRLAVQWILVLGALAVIISEILLATMPDQQSYWAQVFPATILQSFCPDFIFTAAQIVACNNVRRHEQGIAGSLLGTLQLYATSTGLGFAGLVDRQMADPDRSPTKGYRAALWFAVALAALALTISVIFVRMPKDRREGWQGEDAEPETMDSGSKDNSPV